MITAANTMPPYHMRMAARLCHTGPSPVQIAYNKEAQKEDQQTTPSNNITQVIGAVQSQAAFIVFAHLSQRMVAVATGVSYRPFMCTFRPTITASTSH